MTREILSKYLYRTANHVQVWIELTPESMSGETNQNSKHIIPLKYGLMYN